MDGFPLNTQLKAIAIIIVCLLVAIFLGFMIGNEDYGTLLLGSVIAAGCAFWFFSGRFFWVITIASSFLAGTFPVLRAAFTPFQILMAMGLVKFLIEDVIIRRVKIKTASRFDLLMITGFMSIILIHGVRDRFGMRFLGSTIWGGRQYVNVFVGLIAFFVIQSVPMRAKLWAKFPYVVLAVVAFDLAVAVVTTVAPGSLYYIYPFYSAVANSPLQEALGYEADITGRIGAFGNFGVILIVFLLSQTSVRKILHPSNFFRLTGLGVGSLFVLISGYRTAVVNALLAFVLTGIRDLKLAVLALLPLFLAFFFIVSVVNSEFVALPRQVQRGLAFLPGKWDTEMAQDARSSNDFRFAVWTLWWRQYFPRQPILGRGFGFKQEWATRSIYYGNAVDYRQMVETGNIHNGLLASVDTFGLLGTIFFVAWNVVTVARTLRISFDRRAGEHLALRFLALYLAVTMIFYWIGATSIGTSLPGEFALIGLFLRLRKDLRTGEEPAPRPAPAMPRTFRREFAHI